MAKVSDEILINEAVDRISELKVRGNTDALKYIQATLVAFISETNLK